ncbi:MAG TPA: hypothetical protein VMT85_01950 [Thermoanaerobaculia bacterium]|nr:hypothetical protein [Thermoanaerobaculia bacterium]
MRLHHESRPSIGLLAGALTLSIGLASGIGQAAAAEGDTVPGAPWARLASDVGNSPLQPGIRRPAVLGYTNSYVYGAATPFGNSVEWKVSVDDAGYGEPTTLYIYWWNRDNDQFRWLNLPGGGFLATEVDVFGTAGAPIKIAVPDLADFCLFGDDGCAFGPYPGSLPQTTGQYALVFELRNSNGTQVIARDYALFSFVDAVVQKSGTINANETWTANNAYFLTTPVIVGNATLTIQEGTFVLGSEAGQGLLNVSQQGAIQAVGTANKPIVFTSEKDRDDRSVGDWGGVSINGEAPVNVPNPQGEGDTGTYGGENAGDNSGRLEYVRIEFAGVRFNDEDELNALALQGVGSGTTVENIQTISGADDGIEMFGGTVNGRNWFVYNANDDSIDWTFGWRGSVENACVVQTFGDTDAGIEADNNEDNPTLQPQSNPTFTNLAILSLTANDNPGMVIRRGSGVTINNAGIVGAARAALLIGGATSQANITLNDVLAFNVGALAALGDDDGADAVEIDAPPGLTAGNPRWADPTSVLHPDMAPLQGDNGCTTRANDWTQLPWVNYDAGPR